MKKRVLVTLLTCACLLAGCGAKTEDEIIIDPVFEGTDIEEESSEDIETESEEAADEYVAVPTFITSNRYIYEYAKDENGNDIYMEDRLLGGWTQLLDMTNESKEQYPELGKAITALSADLDSAEEAQKADMLARCAAQRASDPNAPAYDFYHRFYMQRVDHNYASFLEENNHYDGGAHATITLTGYTFDVTTGKKVELSDVITNTDRFKAYLAGASSTTVNFDDIDVLSLAWYLDADGVTIVLNAPDDVDYATGPQAITVPYSADCINPEYDVERGQGYICQYPVMLASNSHMDSIYTWKDLTLEPEFPEGYDLDDPYVENLNVNFNGSSVYLDDLFCWGLYAYRVQTADDRPFIWVTVTGDSDWHGDYLIDIHDGQMKQTDYQYLYQAHYNTNDGIDYTISDPDHMLLAEHLDLLSTYRGIKTYHIDADGKFESDDKYFMAAPLNSLTTVADIEGTLVDEEGNELEPATIPSGSEVDIYRTDGNKLVDVKLKDGRLIRLALEFEEYVYEATINGVPAEDLFEMLYYAG